MVGATPVAFSQDGQHLLAGNGTEYRLWKTGSREPLWTLPREHSGGTGSRMAFAPDGQMLAVLHGREERIKFHATASGLELASLDEGWPLCFSADGTQFAAYDNQGHKILVWDLGRVRKELAALNLDWERPPLPPGAITPAAHKLRLTILGE